MKYRCYYCHSDFPLKDRIDAYEQGYHVGFLCPLCGENIQDAPLAGNLLKTPYEARIYVLILLILAMPIVLTRYSDDVVVIFGVSIGISLFLTILWIMLTAFIYWKVPKFRSAFTTMQTQPVDSKDKPL